MKNLLLASCVAALFAAPAFANPVMKNSPNSSQVYGDGSAAQTQRATGGRAAANSYGAPVTVNNYDSGASGSGRGAGAQGSGTAAGPSGYAAGVHVDARQAPDVLVPSVGGGGADCPVVGFGVGGSGLSGGGGFGPSWISPDCNARKLAELLEAMGRHDLAMAVLEDQYPVLKRAADERQRRAQQVSQEVPVRPVGANDYCFEHMTKAERARYREACK